MDGSTRIYKYVHHHKAKGGGATWVVQRSGYPYLSHKDQHEAAKLAAKEFGVSTESLMLGSKSSASHAKSQYQYVNFHARRGSWFAQARGTWIGTYATEHEAALAVVKAGLATSTQELLKRKDQRGQPRAVASAKTKAHANAKVKHFTGVLTKQVFSDMWQVYRDYRGSSAVPCLPGDLDDLIANSSLPFTQDAKKMLAFHMLLKCHMMHSSATVRASMTQQEAFCVCMCM